jgi:hypothetical protein
MWVKDYMNQPSDDIFYKFTLSASSEVTISLCNSTLNDTYLHLLNSDGTWISSNDDYCNLKSQITEVLNAGTYYIVVEGYENNSGSITTTISLPSLKSLVMDSKTIITDDNGDDEIIVFPNPASNNVNISGLKNNSTIQFIDVSGRTVLQQKIARAAKVNIDINSLTIGIYIMQIQDDIQSRLYKLVIKR